jgi:hypothetical protein
MIVVNLRNMITHRIVSLPFGPPAVYFVRTVEEIEKPHWFFFKKKIKTYSDSPPGTLEQVEAYIKANNIHIDKADFWG